MKVKNQESECFRCIRMNIEEKEEKYMSTRSRIAVKNSDGSYTSVYCHWDGYPEHNGAVLSESYASPQRVHDLINMGDLSFLGRKLYGSKDDSDTTIAYCRDLGHEFNCCHDKSYEELLSRFGECSEEYLYIYEDGEWLCTNGFSYPCDVQDWIDREEAM